MHMRIPSNVYYPLLGRCYGTLNQLPTQEGEKVRISTVVTKEWCEYPLRLGLGICTNTDRSRERMAEAFYLEVEGWDSETSLHDSASESSAPGDGPPASKRRRLSLSLTRTRATCKPLCSCGSSEPSPLSCQR